MSLNPFVAYLGFPLRAFPHLRQGHLEGKESMTESGSQTGCDEP